MMRLRRSKIGRIEIFLRNLERKFIHTKCPNSPLYVHHVSEQIEQVIQVISTESVQCSVVVMAAGAKTALHFHYDRSNTAHSKVHSWCTPFILNEEVAAAVQ